jgi:hypothetical protein
MNRRAVLASAVAALSVVTLVSPVTSAQASRPDLERTLLGAMRSAQFDTMIDYGPVGDACPDDTNPDCVFPAPQIATMPNVDVAVITLDERGRVDDVANVIISRDQPRGRLVSIDSKTMAPRDVTFRAWDIDRWNGDTPWDQQPLPTALNEPKRSRTDFASPYPASLFKILVAWHVMTLVDDGKVALDAPFTDSTGATLTVAEWMDAMITFSDNAATRAMVFMLHQMNEVDAMNAGFAALGLTTLQINGTDPATGGNWNPGSIHMNALDTAKLFLLIQGGSGTLWRAPDGRRVTDAEMSDGSRAFLTGLLADQGFNEVLSTGNMCGAPYTTPGIPAVVPERWIDPADGSVTVEGIPYFVDVRPCNDAATVTFAHKTGLTWNYGSDGGIVESLPGEPERTYIIVMLSNLGYRYNDAEYASATVNPCFDPGVCYSKKFAVLGATIDEYLVAEADD